MTPTYASQQPGQRGVVPTVPTNGILQEDNTFFIMLEDGTSYIIQE